MTKNSSLFQRYLALVLLVAIIPMIATSIAMFTIAQNRAQQDMLRANEAYVRSSELSLKAQMSWLKRATLFWCDNDNLKKNLSSLWTTQAISSYSEFSCMQTVLAIINSMETSSTLIECIDIYLPQTHMLFSNYDSCAPVINAKALAFYNQAAAAPGGSILINHHNSPVYLQHMDVAVGNSVLFLVTLNQSTLNSLTDTFCMSHENSAILLDHNGALLGASGPYTSLCQRWLNMPDQSDSATLCSDDGVMHMMMRGVTSDNAWQYVLALPLNTVLTPLQEMRQFFLLTTFACLLLAALLAWLTSKRIYHPIHQLADSMTAETGLPSGQDDLLQIQKTWNHLVREKNNVENRLLQGISLLREGYLLRLLSGNTADHTEDRVRQEFYELFGQQCPAYCRMVFMRLFGLSLPRKSHQQDNAQITLLTAYEIVSQSLGEYPDLLALPLISDNNELFLLMLHSDDGQQQENLITDFIRLLSDRIHHSIGVFVAASISRPSTHLLQVPTLLDEARKLCGYRSLSLENQILKERSVPDDETGTHYPFELEKKLIHALLIGDGVSSAQLCAEIFQSFSLASHAHLHNNCVIQLISGLQRAMMQNGFSQEQLFIENLPHAILSVPVSDRCIRFEQLVLQPYLSLVDAFQNDRQKNAVTMTIDAIQKNYMEDVSLEYYADLQNMNSATLSRAFKRYVGQSFIDYITMVRIDKAKELLLKTDFKISEIAEKVGYRATYFNRIFRAHEGITPGDFRAQNDTSYPASPR